MHLCDLLAFIYAVVFSMITLGKGIWPLALIMATGIKLPKGKAAIPWPSTKGLTLRGEESEMQE